MASPKLKSHFLTNTVSITSDVDLEGCGAIREEGGKRYMWVKAAVALLVKQAVGYVGAPDPTAVDGVQVTNVVANQIGALGVAHVAIPLNNYGWVQIGGLADVLDIEGTPAVGQRLKKGAAAGSLLVTAAVTDSVFGTAVDVTPTAMKVVLHPEGLGY